MTPSPAPTAGAPGAVIVTGMHRSGTSLLASFLEAAGLDLGEELLPAAAPNPRGYFEDVGFLQLQQEILHACTVEESGWRDWGWTESQRLDLTGLPAFRPRAEELVRRRQAAGGTWGFKDPRTTILLDFWLEVVPDARFLFIYRTPWEVAASVAALRQVPFAEHPDFAPRIWQFYNRQLLEFHRRHGERCLLLEAGALLARPEEVLARARAKLGLALAAPERGAEILAQVRGGGKLGATADAAGLWQVAARAYRREAELWEELEGIADLPAGRPLPPLPPLPPSRLSPPLPPTPAPAPGPAGAADAGQAVQPPPDFTVVIPCFNQGEFLLAAVASVEAAEDAVPELVIVNDGSTDPFTLDMLHRLRDAGYRVLDRPNGGVGAARNTGIAATRGRYVLPLDADNRMLPAYLARAAAVFAADPAVGVVYGDATLAGRRRGLWRMPDFDLGQMATGNRIDACGAFRRQVWEECGGYDEAVELGWEDWDFWLSVAERGWRFVHVPEPLFEYRVQADSIAAVGARQESRRRMLGLITAKHAATFVPRLPAMFAEKDAHWQAAEARAAALDEALGRERAAGDGLRGEVQALSQGLDAARAELAAARQELAAARAGRDADQAEIGRWRERVGALEATRAFRLRAWLLRLRRRGGAPG